MRNRLTQDAPTLFRDQWGHTFRASSLQELRTKVRDELGECGRVSKQYTDKTDGRTVWNGYVIGRSWFTAYKWAEVEP